MIVELEADHIPNLCRVYNEGIARVPHCYPVDERRFKASLGPALGDGKGPDRLDNERVFVATHGSEPAAFVHIADYHLKNGSVHGAIRFLMYHPGDRATGQALLDRALEHLAGRDRIVAFHQNCRYRFYHRSCAYLSDRLGHVQALLQINGFERTEGEIFFDWDEFDIDPGDSPVEVKMTQKIGEETEFRPGLEVGAMKDDEEIAACHILSCGSWTDEPSVQDRLFVKWLGVEEDYQGKGLGRYTLLYTMKAAREMGYRHAAISTAVSNHRAFVFYSNIGFRVTDMTYGWSLDTSPSADGAATEDCSG